MYKFSKLKAVQAINFFVKKEGGRCSYMKVIKLVSLSDRLHLQKYGRPITGDKYYALKHGIVPSTTLDIAKVNSLGRYDVGFIDEIDSKQFSKTDLEVLEAIYEEFGKLNQFELRDISHKLPEWIRHKEHFEAGKETRRKVVEKDFFKKPEEDLGIFQIEDELLDITKELYL